MDARHERGVQLAQRGHIVKQADGWQVLSQTGNGNYLVRIDPPLPVPVLTLNSANAPASISTPSNNGLLGILLPMAHRQ